MFSAQLSSFLGVVAINIEKAVCHFQLVCLLLFLILDVPRLQPLEQPEEEQRESEIEEELPKDKKNRKTSGPKVKDPYELDEGISYFYPFLVAVGLFIPTLLCLCKL